MNGPARLALFGAGLIVAFGGAYGIAYALAPAGVGTDSEPTDAHATQHAAGPSAPAAAPEPVAGLALSDAGYQLSGVNVPGEPGTAGELAFRVERADGTPVTGFTEVHERDLHLIVVRTDGAGYRHVHPVLDPATGVWSLPWQWDQPGTYRVFADFTPTDGPALTLSRTVDVAGPLTVVDAHPTATAEVDGFTVRLDGDLVAGTPTTLAATVSRDGHPVGDLEPYLGALGHLVALRSGDLAYLHVHADDAPAGIAGAQVGFHVTAPTAGRYLLYLDFQVDGTVHTAQFVLDATPAGAADTAGSGHAHEGASS